MKATRTVTLSVFSLRCDDKMEERFGGFVLAAQPCKEQLQLDLENAKKENAKLKKQKAAWMAAAIVCLAMFVITLALKLS